jgi:class III poly(R)-hydroxyalkanoic acid synthase PhaE subunit
LSNSPDWFEAQQDAWRSWRAAFGQNSLNTMPFANLWQAFGIDPAKTTGDTSGQWLSNAFEEIQKMMNTGQPATHANFSDIFRAPLTQTIFGLGGMPNPFGVGESDLGSRPDFSAWQSLPPLGLFREWQSAWREVVDAQVEQNKASHALSRQLGPIFETAVKRFVKSINAQDDGLEDITSLRALYDLWISIAEKAYAEKVMTAQYSKAYGSFVNASARYRLAIQTLTNDVAEAANLPSRRELDALIARQHELQAEVQSLQRSAANGYDTEAVERTIAQLSERVAALTATSSNAEKQHQIAPKKRREVKSSNTVNTGKRRDLKSPSTAIPRKRRATNVNRTPKPRPAKAEFDIASFDASNPPRKP